MNNLAKIMSSPWAITPDMLNEVHAIYDAHRKGETIDIAAVERKIGRPLDNSKNIMTIQEGVAIIEIQGTIAKRINLLSDISGGCSSQLVSNYFQQAVNDPNIKGIILNVDSPGGTVDGTSELAEIVYQARGAKPIIAFSDGMIASAAYWISSACDNIFISGDTNPIGSIGVVSGHRDFSGQESMKGIKTTEISAGAYKRVASQYEPLTAEGRAEIQASVNYLYGIFVDTVARNRGTSSKRVLADMADGRMFQGRQAIKAGLVEDVSTLEQLISNMKTGKPIHRAAGAKATTMQIQPAITNATFNTVLSLKGVQAPVPTKVDDSAERKKIVASIAAGGEQINVHAQDQVRTFPQNWGKPDNAA